MSQQAFQRGFIKAALDNGFSIIDAANLLKLANIDPGLGNLASISHEAQQGLAGHPGMLGAGIGAGAGIATGAKYGIPAGILSGLLQQHDSKDKEKHYLTGALGGGLAGGGLGALVGGGIGGLAGGGLGALAGH